MTTDGEAGGDRLVRQGPLTGVRVVELAGLGPAPHACMVDGVSTLMAVTWRRRAGPTLDPRWARIVPDRLLARARRGAVWAPHGAVSRVSGRLVAGEGTP